jgi:hypothetical protein
MLDWITTANRNDLDGFEFGTIGGDRTVRPRVDHKGRYFRQRPDGSITVEIETADRPVSWIAVQ